MKKKRAKGALVEQLGGEMRTLKETVTPEKAKTFLEKQKHVRPINWKWVDDLAGRILRNEWHVLHQGIALDADGALVDGQHRLNAIIQADEAVEMNVTYGVDPEAWKAIDTGRKRTPGNFLAMRGHSNGNLLAASLGLLVGYEDGFPGRKVPRLTFDQMDAAMERWPDLPEFKGQAAALAKYAGMLPGAAMACAYIIGIPLKDEDGRHTEWYEGVLHGVNCTADDPRLALYRTFHNQIRNHKERGGMEHMGLFGKAFNAFQNGDKIRVLAFRRDEQVPLFGKYSRR